MNNLYLIIVKRNIAGKLENIFHLACHKSEPFSWPLSSIPNLLDGENAKNKRD